MAKVFFISSLAAVDQASFLDYIFNPCSLLSIDMHINGQDYKSYFANFSAEEPVLVNLCLSASNKTGAVVTGQVVSFKILKESVGSYNLSMLLMPYGISEPIKGNAPFSDTLLAQSSFQTMSGVSIKPTSLFNKTLNFSDVYSSIDPSQSALGNMMVFRRSRAQEGLRAYLSTMKMGTKTRGFSFPHHLIYFGFGSILASPTKDPILTTPLLHRHVDFSAIDGNASDFLDKVKAQSDVQISFAAGSQGLANAAFSYIPNTINSFTNIASFALNETYTIELSGKVPYLFPSFSFGKELGTFGVYRISRPPKDDVAPVWSPSDNAIHIKTMYQFVRQGNDVSSGHRVQYILARLNKNLCPNGR